MGALKTEAPVDYSLRMERLLFKSGWVEGLLGAFLGALKREAPVDYSLRIERLLFRSGCVEGIWGEEHHFRGPARFCQVKASKSAPLSWSGSFLLIKRFKKCTTLVVRLVVAR